MKWSQDYFQKPVNPSFPHACLGRVKRDVKWLSACLDRLSSSHKALAFREGSDTLSWGNLTATASDPKERDKVSAGAGGGRWGATFPQPLGMCVSKDAEGAPNSQSDCAHEALSSYLLLVSVQGSICA